MCVAQLTVPALKDRAVDLPLIVQKLMDEAAAASGLKPRKFSEEAMIMMQSYSWPGDLIQLRNMIDWLLIMTSQDGNDPIIATQLPHDIINGNTFSSSWQNKSADIVVLPLREAREAFEREYLITQVNRFAGNISQTARFVGMERSALHRKLRALKVHDPRSVEDDPYIITSSS
jgi:two-component system nitrogen regulation response regulator NtrX